MSTVVHGERVSPIQLDAPVLNPSTILSRRNEADARQIDHDKPSDVLSAPVLEAETSEPHSETPKALILDLDSYEPSWSASVDTIATKSTCEGDSSNASENEDHIRDQAQRSDMMSDSEASYAASQDSFFISLPSSSASTLPALWDERDIDKPSGYTSSAYTSGIEEIEDSGAEGHLDG